MSDKITVTITITKLRENHWEATCSDVLWDGYPVGVIEITPSWALSHACEMIVDALNEQRAAGRDWPVNS